MNTDIEVQGVRIVVDDHGRGGQGLTDLARAVRATIRAQEVTTEQFIAALRAIDERLGTKP
jgi:hypothetical protein